MRAPRFPGRTPVVARLAAVLFWFSVLAVATLSLLPADRLPPMVFDWWDKAQHALGFAWLAACGLWAYPQRSRPLVWGLLGFGAGIELAQAATGWRYGEAADWCADAVGVFAVLGLWVLRPRARCCGKTVESPPRPR